MKPILFGGEMVRAILDGKKTQTRRVVKVPWVGRSTVVPYSPYYEEVDGVLMMDGDLINHPGWVKMVRLAEWKIGDKLWVRESWHAPIIFDELSPRDIPYTAPIFYPADTCLRAPVNGEIEIEMGKKRPSIFLPRWASRLTLEVTGVRVERVQDISEWDAVAEGITDWTCHCGVPANGLHVGPHHDPVPMDATLEFMQLWDSINAKRGYGWDTNPWVWVVEFKRLEEV